MKPKTKPKTKPEKMLHACKLFENFEIQDAEKRVDFISKNFKDFQEMHPFISVLFTNTIIAVLDLIFDYSIDLVTSVNESIYQEAYNDGVESCSNTLYEPNSNF